MRHIHYAYSIAKGKRPHQIEYNPKTPIEQKLYTQILNDYIPPLAVYIITDTSLPSNTYIPQSCHAALLFYKYNGPLKDLWAERDRTIVVLGTSDMDATIKKLKEDGHYPTIWTEDDYDHKITSIVIGPVIKAEAQEYFKDYRLLK